MEFASEHIASLGVPLLAVLSIMHGVMPPHPGPVAYLGGVELGRDASSVGQGPGMQGSGTGARHVPSPSAGTASPDGSFTVFMPPLYPTCSRGRNAWAA